MVYRLSYFAILTFCLAVFAGCSISFIQYERDVVVIPANAGIQKATEIEASSKSLWDSLPIVEPVLRSIFEGLTRLSVFNPTNKALEPDSNKIYLTRKRLRIGLFIGRNHAILKTEKEPFWESVKESMP